MQVIIFYGGIWVHTLLLLLLTSMVSTLLCTGNILGGSQPGGMTIAVAGTTEPPFMTADYSLHWGFYSFLYFRVVRGFQGNIALLCI